MSLLSDLINLNLSDTTEKVIAEYIWIGGSGMDLRSKARTLSGPVSEKKKLPKWNYDGSSIGQAPGEDSEVIIYPQAIFKDLFRRGNNKLVMCDTYTPGGEPIPTNKRFNAVSKLEMNCGWLVTSLRGSRRLLGSWFPLIPNLSRVIGMALELIPITAPSLRGVMGVLRSSTTEPRPCSDKRLSSWHEPPRWR
ncbi:glutamine synthetase cytosolic isozyme 2-like [Camellia sinensis]|uniref:glutamine synthetase cytosolic isozyme 2-like n=1 Tax=Camellia sinensis TaxID=4442 RepID=UPI0010357F01|nr:glutamine synthetase cytosolic isozyme 2-like [Camellia sinensis]